MHFRQIPRRREVNRIRGFVLLLAILRICVVPHAVSAGEYSGFTEYPHVGIGYSASVPKEMLGFCLFTLRPQGVGLYFDLKGTVPMVSKAPDFYKNISQHEAEGWGDQLFDDKTDWISLNLGITRSLSHNTALYLGVGLSMGTTYYQYYDPYHILGTNGDYWVEGEDTNSINGLVGLLIGLGQNWGFEIGAEAQPSGVSLGIFGVM